MGFETAKTIDAIFRALDPRLAPALRQEYVDRRLTRKGKPAAARRGAWVLAGHRTAGKTTLLPLISALTGLQGLDLDLELERRHGRPLRAWLKEDIASFRAAERALFGELAHPSGLVAVGGGFLALHGDLLAAHTPIVIPVSFETYRERLLADVTRPRLRPELTPEEEIAVVFAEREIVHGRSGALPLVELLATLTQEEP